MGVDRGDLSGVADVDAVQGVRVAGGPDAEDDQPGAAFGAVRLLLDEFDEVIAPPRPGLGSDPDAVRLGATGVTQLGDRRIRLLPATGPRGRYDATSRSR